MRIAVFSDIHGNEPAFQAALADLKAQGDAEQIWFLGDYAAAGPRPAECIRRCLAILAERGKDKVRCIGGNTDRYLVHGERKSLPAMKDAAELARHKKFMHQTSANLDWTLAQLGWEEYDFLRGTIGVEIAHDQPDYGWCHAYHAVPGDDEDVLLPDTPEDIALDFLLEREGRLGIGGHVHLQYDRQVGPWRLLNPGSIGASRDAAGSATWTLLEFAGAELEVTPRVVPYDVAAHQAQLEESGFPYPF